MLNRSQSNEFVLGRMKSISVMLAYIIAENPYFFYVKRAKQPEKDPFFFLIVQRAYTCPQTRPRPLGESVSLFLLPDFIRRSPF